MKFIHRLLLIAIPFYFLSCATQRQTTPYYLEKIDTSGKGEVKRPRIVHPGAPARINPLAAMARRGVLFVQT